MCLKSWCVYRKEGRKTPGRDRNGGRLGSRPGGSADWARTEGAYEEGLCVCRGVGGGLLPCTAMGGTGTTVLSLNGSWDSITPGVKQRKVGRKWEKSLEEIRFLGLWKRDEPRGLSWGGVHGGHPGVLEVHTSVVWRMRRKAYGGRGASHKRK